MEGCHLETVITDTLFRGKGRPFIIPLIDQETSYFNFRTGDTGPITSFYWLRRRRWVRPRGARARETNHLTSSQQPMQVSTKQSFWGILRLTYTWRCILLLVHNCKFFFEFLRVKKWLRIRIIRTYRENKGFKDALHQIIDQFQNAGSWVSMRGAGQNTNPA